MNPTPEETKAREIAAELLKLYLPEESPDAGRGRRFMERCESRIATALAAASSAERFTCSYLALAEKWETRAKELQVQFAKREHSRSAGEGLLVSADTLWACARELRASSLSRWQPISEAPKTKCDLILYSPAWDQKVQPYQWQGNADRWLPKMKPTHWQPLPAPPVKEKPE